MFHRPPRSRARYGPRSGPRSQGCGRTSAARFCVSGGSVPPHRHPVPTTPHPCRHARSTDSPAAHGRTRPSRRPWRGRRVPVGGARTCARSASDAAATACRGTAAGARGQPAWEFREGSRHERVTASATGERHRRPTRAHAGWGDFRFAGSLQQREVADDDDGAARRLKVERVAGGRGARSTANATPGARAERPAAPPTRAAQHESTGP